MLMFRLREANLWPRHAAASHYVFAANALYFWAFAISIQWVSDDSRSTTREFIGVMHVVGTVWSQLFLATGCSRSFDFGLFSFKLLIAVFKTIRRDACIGVEILDAKGLCAHHLDVVDQ